MNLGPIRGAGFGFFSPGVEKKVDLFFGAVTIAGLI